MNKQLKECLENDCKKCEIKDNCDLYNYLDSIKDDCEIDPVIIPYLDTEHSLFKINESLCKYHQIHKLPLKEKEK